jgi:hypothetical protein
VVELERAVKDERAAREHLMSRLDVLQASPPLSLSLCCV